MIFNKIDIIKKYYNNKIFILCLLLFIPLTLYVNSNYEKKNVVEFNIYLYPEIEKENKEDFFSKFVFKIKNANISGFEQQLAFPLYNPELLYRVFINSINNQLDLKTRQLNIYDNYSNLTKYKFKRYLNPYSRLIHYKITTDTNSENVKEVKKQFNEISKVAEDKVKLILTNNYGSYLKNFEISLNETIEKEEKIILYMEKTFDKNPLLNAFILEERYKILKKKKLVEDNFIKNFLIQLENNKIIFSDFENANISVNYRRYLNIILAIFFSFIFTLTINAIRVEIINTSK